MKKNAPQLYLLYGDEPFLIHEFIQNIRAEYQQAEFINCTGESISEKQLIEICTALPFFNNHQIYHFPNILENSNLSSESENLQKALLVPPNHLTLIFSHDGQPDKRKKIFKFFASLSEVLEFKPLQGATLFTWIQEQFKAHNSTYEPQVISLLESLLGNNLWLLSREIEKLCIFAQNHSITEDDLNKIISAVNQANIFTFVDMLGHKKTNRALEMLHSLVSDKYDVIPLLTMITRQFRLILQCLSLKEQYKNDWKKHLQLHPFVAQKIEQQAKNFNIPKLQEIYQKLYYLDKQMKTTSNDPIGLVDRLVVELTS